MTIDIGKIRPGDKVTLVPLEVAECDTGDAAVRVMYGDVFGDWIGADQIAAHHPAPREIGVGDRVRLVGRPHWKGTVRGVDGRDAWVKWDVYTEARPERPLSDLTLVEGDHERA